MKTCHIYKPLLFQNHQRKHVSTLGKELVYSRVFFTVFLTLRKLLKKLWQSEDRWIKSDWVGGMHELLNEGRHPVRDTWPDVCPRGARGQCLKEAGWHFKSATSFNLRNEHFIILLFELFLTSMDILLNVSVGDGFRTTPHGKNLTRTHS